MFQVSKIRIFYFKKCLRNIIWKMFIQNMHWVHFEKSRNAQLSILSQISLSLRNFFGLCPHRWLEDNWRLSERERERDATCPFITQQYYPRFSISHYSLHPTILSSVLYLSLLSLSLSSHNNTILGSLSLTILSFFTQQYYPRFSISHYSLSLFLHTTILSLGLNFLLSFL